MDLFKAIFASSDDDSSSDDSDGEEEKGAENGAEKGKLASIDLLHMLYS